MCISDVKYKASLSKLKMRGDSPPPSTKRGIFQNIGGGGVEQLGT